MNILYIGFFNKEVPPIPLYLFDNKIMNLIKIFNLISTFLYNSFGMNEINFNYTKLLG